MIGLINDPQTSGGLLVSVPAEKLDGMLVMLKEEKALACAVIGEVSDHQDDNPWLSFY